MDCIAVLFEQLGYDGLGMCLLAPHPVTRDTLSIPVQTLSELTLQVSSLLLSEW
jgi:hypothetical protein